MEQLLQREQEALKHFFTNLDRQQIDGLVESCRKVRGLIVLSGVGKSGLVAEKIVATLISTGTRALFVPPVNFLHGELGILTPDDLLLLLSKSGETEELMAILPFAKRRGTPIALLHSNPHGKLVGQVDQALHLPLAAELCPFDLAPTISTVLQMIVGDLIAVALMQSKRFSLDQYAENHPGGAIGKKATLRVEDLMVSGEALPLCSFEQKLAEVLPELTGKACGCLLAIDAERQLQGIFTDGDLRRAIQTHGSGALALPMSALATQRPITLAKGMLAWDAVKQLQRDPKKWVMVAPVIEEKRVVGLLRMHDVVQAGLG